MGPFKETIRGNRFVIVIGDYFTKWMEAYPVPNHKAETVATTLVDNFFSSLAFLKRYIVTKDEILNLNCSKPYAVYWILIKHVRRHGIPKVMEW